MSKYRIWHVANPPHEAYRFGVESPAAALPLLAAIADFDLFVGDGDDKPWTTVGQRLTKVAELINAHGRHVRAGLLGYVKHITDRCGGCPVVAMNAQGLEVLDEDGDWVEWYDDETGNSISEVTP